MEFTYKGFQNLISILKNKDYQFVNYHNWSNYNRCVIFRHDIDYNLQKALNIAEIEYDEGISSTFFLLVTSDFYNVFSKESEKTILKIVKYGHEIGLHFDEMHYQEHRGNMEYMCDAVVSEAKILSQAVGIKVSAVSMHRPSKEFLEANINFPGMVNSYNKTFFCDFKYLSDSRRRWREPIDEIIKKENEDRLHILTHPFWYEEREQGIEISVKNFINNGNSARYKIMNDNITNLSSIMSADELSR